MAATIEPKSLSRLQVGLLKFASAVCELRSILPVNHAMQKQLTKMAAAITKTARQIESKD